MNLSDNVNLERSGTKPSTDGGYEADGFESLIHTSSIRVEYYRSFEYCLKWEIPMYSRRSSRLLKASKKSPRRSPSPTEEVIQRRLRSNRQKTGLKKTQADVSVVNTDEKRDRDVIDIINSAHDAKRVAEEDDGNLVEVADEVLDEDCHSVTGSIASGPSLPLTTPKKMRPSLGMCSACQKLYQKAKKMKRPIKNKLLDNDPKSLTCDHWVLIKNWRPRRLPNARGKLLTHVKLIKKRLDNAKQTKQCAGEEEASSCLRPHTFLRRNLRHQIVRVPVKRGRKKNNRKRKRDDSQSSRNAKKHLQSNSHRQHTSVGCTDNDGLQTTNSYSSSPGFEGQETDSETDVNLSVELLPSAVTLDATKPREVPAKQKAPKKTAGFRDLLAKLRSNSSMIVRETR